jgi:dTDP-4-dehydrorhamnose reductase
VYGHDVSGWSGRRTEQRGAVALEPVDLTDGQATERALAAADPEVVIHAAAMSRADAVLRDPVRAQALNVEATGRLAEWCAVRGRRLIYTSSDLVFSGSRAWSREYDPAEPVMAYGRSKRAAEPLVLAIPQGLVARLSLLYGPTRSGRAVYYDNAIAALSRGEPQTFFEDEFRTPLDLATAAQALVRLGPSAAHGVVHVAGPERVSRFAMMRRVAAALGLDPAFVRANRQADVAAPEPRPADVSLDSERLLALLPGLERPSIEEAVARMHRGALDAVR